MPSKLMKHRLTRTKKEGRTGQRQNQELGLTGISRDMRSDAEEVHHGNDVEATTCFKHRTALNTHSYIFK
jgi:hypothetical protein